MPPSSAKNPSPSTGKTTRTSLPGKLEATNYAARLMLVAFTGTVKAPPSPLTSTDRFTKVVRESSTMSRMVEDLLFLARTESAATPFRMEPVEAQVLLAGPERRAGALAAEHDATFDTTLLATGLVRVDPVRLEQAILALVDNAVKYDPEGQRVTLGSACSEGESRVDVGDRGPGIPETELPHIFERFYRLAGAEEPGSGLGLSIAQTIVEAHGGRIEAQSQPGEGTRMSFILPLLQEGSKVR
jgi:two-component system, OmpR family, sensor histidine kinase VicK